MVKFSPEYHVVLITIKIWNDHNKTWVMLSSLPKGKMREWYRSLRKEQTHIMNREFRCEEHARTALKELKTTDTWKRKPNLKNYVVLSTTTKAMSISL